MYLGVTENFLQFVPEDATRNYKAISFGHHLGIVKKESAIVTELPGPGTFVLPETKRGPSFSFGERFGGSIPLDHPKLLTRRKLVEREEHQPEYLDPPSLMGTSPGVKISPPSKNRKKPEPGVGPGTYEPQQSEYSPKYTIPGKRAKSHIPSPSPGPGDYKSEAAVNYLFPSLSKTISTVVPEIKQGYCSGTPGPGTYDPKSGEFVPGVKIKKPVGHRLVSPIKEERVIKEIERPKKSPPVFPTFGNAERHELANKFATPAPNMYQSVELKGKGKRGQKKRSLETCTFGVKTEKFYKPNYNPGPGTYLPDMPTSSSPQFSIGSSKRKSLEFPVYVDRYYDAINIFAAPGVGFTGEKRDFEVKKTKLPGPGSYDINHLTSRESQEMSLSTR